MTPAPPSQRHVAAQTAPLAAASADSEDTLFSGLDLTDDQKTKIAQIHKDLDDRIDLVKRDDRDNADQKEALIQGMQLMERQNVYLVLTPEQRREVNKKLATKSTSGRRTNTSQPHRQTR